MLGQIVNGVRPDRFCHNHQSFVRLGICLWDDIIEYGGQQSWKYSEFYLPALARGIQDSQPEVRLILLFFAINKEGCIFPMVVLDGLPDGRPPLYTAPCGNRTIGKTDPTLQ